MSNSPQENLQAESDAVSDETQVQGGCRAEGLVEDVLRDARSLLGESTEVGSDPGEGVGSAIDRAGMDAEELLGDLERLSEDLVSEIESNTIDPAKDADQSLDGIKRGPAARDLGSEGPQVDLFGVAVPPDATSAPPIPSGVADADSGEVSATIEPDQDATNRETSSPAAALEALMASRIAEESVDEDPMPAAAEARPNSDDSSEIARAEAAERSAMASLDAMGGNAPLRSTAGEVEAVSSGDPTARIDFDSTASETSPTTSSPSAPQGRSSSESASIEAIDDSESAREDGATLDSSPESGKIETETASIDSSPDDDSKVVVDAPPEPSPARVSSVIARIAALPFRLLPSSVHGLVNVAAISLVFWIPVAWTYAILGPGVFERMLPSAILPVDPSHQVDPVPSTAAESGAVAPTSTDADAGDPPSTP